MAMAAALPGHPPLLERDAEIAAIAALVDAVRHGAGRMIAIEARAGMGKTRLVAEARRLARDARLEVLAARGGELEQGFAFGVVRQLFEPLLTALRPSERSEVTGGAAALALPLFDERRLAAFDDAAGDTSFAVLHGLYWLAANLALRRPTLLTVDDLHWVDGPSLRWIGYLARRLEGLPLLVLVASRPPEQSREAELLAEILAEILADPAAVAVRPGPLSTDAVDALARAAFAAEPAVAFVAACKTATGGNPLFLRALLESLADRRIPPTAENATRVLETGPEAVSRSVSLRLARLAPDASALIRAAAVLGDGVHLHQVAALARLPVGDAARAASALVRWDLLRQEDPLEFVHPVVRTAVLAELGADERSRAHRDAAELLVAGGATLEQAAAHLVQTLPSRDAWVTSILRRAADRSLAQGAPQAAIAYLRRALEEPLSSGGERAETLRALGVAELHTDAFAASEHLRDAFDASEGTVARAEAALLYARSLVWLDRFAGAVDVLVPAIDALDDRHAELRELLEAVLIGCTLWDPALRDVGLERVARVREEALLGGLSAAVMRSLLSFHELRTGTSRERAVGLATAALESGWLRRSETLWGLTAMVTLSLAGEVDRAAAAFAGAIDEARRTGDLVGAVPLLILRAWLALDRGDLRAAEEDLRSSEFELAAGASTTAAYREIFLAELLLEQGRLDEATRTVEALRSAEPTHSEYRFLYLLARARVLRANGRLQEALTDLRAVAAMLDALGGSNPALAPWRSETALTLHLLGRSAEARELGQEELELARRWGARRTVGVALRGLGVVTPGAEGERLLREAIDVLARSPARLEHARALVDLGARLRRANRRADAQDLLRQGLDVAHRIGAAALVTRAQEELGASGARPRNLVLTGVDALTASERRVAKMASGGMSNKEIAQALFVTVKAVEVHLSNVYRKLEIESRRQLPAALAGAAAAADAL